MGLTPKAAAALSATRRTVYLGQNRSAEAADKCSTLGTSRATYTPSYGNPGTVAVVTKVRHPGEAC